jgi:hypothetical protein
MVGFFLNCAAEGMPFYEAMESLWSKSQTKLAYLN